MHLLFLFIPATRCFAFKRNLLRWAGASVGNNVNIVSSARFYTSGSLIIGDDTWVGHEVLIAGGSADVCIGSNVDIGPRVTIVTGSHELFTVSERAAGRGYSLPIKICDGVWIGAGSTILGGTIIEKCGMVAAGALVCKNVSTKTVVGGVPAKILQKFSMI